jgi:predicted enzyme related to lactoylglutathione lyase
MGRPVVHFEIVGRDGKKLQDFYASLFDWKIDADNPMGYGSVEAGEGGIGGGVAQSDSGPLVTLYVQVASLEETLRKAESLHGKTVMPPMEVPGGPTIAVFQDPEGNTIGLVKE